MPSTRTRPPTTRRVTGTFHFPGGFAWPAGMHRSGFWLVAHHGQPLLNLAVCDDFGDLQAVPSIAFADGGCALPTAYFPEQVH